MEERSCVTLINVGNSFINFDEDQGKAKLLYQSSAKFKGYLAFLKIWRFCINANSYTIREENDEIGPLHLEVTCLDTR